MVFKRSEFLLSHGAVDIIMDRRDMRDRLGGLLAKLTHRTLDYCVMPVDNELNTTSTSTQPIEQDGN